MTGIAAAVPPVPASYPTATPRPALPAGGLALELDIAAIRYGERRAVRDVALNVPTGAITAFIGPSGCGKSTVLRCINRMNDVIPGFALEGSIQYHGQNLYARHVDAVVVRRHIGMVFQQPNPFPMSVFDNVAFGLRLQRRAAGLADKVEDALRRAALWDEMKDKLRHAGTRISGGQAQRLCIARAIATNPDVLLMDEPCSALDPISTGKIEELMVELKRRHAIVIVTHNLQQARRVADETAFFYVDAAAEGRPGYLVEHGPTPQVFERPRDDLTRRYVAGAFG